MKFHFTCGEWKLYWNFVYFQVIMQRIVWDFLLHFSKWLNFLNVILLWLRFGRPVKNVTTIESWKLSKVSFWPKSNMPNDTSTTLLSFEFFHNCVALFLLWRLKKDLEVTINSKIKFEGDWDELEVSLSF